jgi:hypothetical protein
VLVEIYEERRHAVTPACWTGFGSYRKCAVLSRTVPTIIMVTPSLLSPTVLVGGARAAAAGQYLRAHSVFLRVSASIWNSYMSKHRHQIQGKHMCCMLRREPQNARNCFTAHGPWDSHDMRMPILALALRHGWRAGDLLFFEKISDSATS